MPIRKHIGKLHDIGFGKEFSTTKPTLQQMLKELL